MLCTAIRPVLPAGALRRMLPLGLGAADEPCRIPGTNPQPADISGGESGLPAPGGLSAHPLPPPGAAGSVGASLPRLQRGVPLLKQHYAVVLEAAPRSLRLQSHRNVKDREGNAFPVFFIFNWQRTPALWRPRCGAPGWLPSEAYPSPSSAGWCWHARSHPASW